MKNQNERSKINYMSFLSPKDCKMTRITIGTLI